jgi:broad specificity phosphatase PhoE
VNRRRIYLMRHGEVSYYENGRPVHPDVVALTAAGREQAKAAAHALAGIEFDRVITSSLPRTVETARIVAPGVELESWPELRELTAGRLAEFSFAELEGMFLGAFKDVVPEDARFLGGETIGSLYDRAIAALERLLADDSWDIVLAVLHGGVNRAILSYALTGGRTFLGNLEQAPACINILDVGAACGADIQDVRASPVRPSEPTGRPAQGRSRRQVRHDWIARAVNVTPYDLAHRRGRSTTMEELWSQFRST